MTGHVFISYRHGEEDAAYVEKLATFLTAPGLPVWFDRPDLGLRHGKRTARMPNRP